MIALGKSKMFFTRFWQSCGWSAFLKSKLLLAVPFKVFDDSTGHHFPEQLISFPKQAVFGFHKIRSVLPYCSTSSQNIWSSVITDNDGEFIYIEVLTRSIWKSGFYCFYEHVYLSGFACCFHQASHAEHSSTSVFKGQTNVCKTNYSEFT